MKRYKLKEKYKPAFQTTYHDAVLTYGGWNSNGVTFEALEEVEIRIELELRTCPKYGIDVMNKTEEDPFTDQEKELCEKALNGELFTKDDLYQFAQKCLYKCEGEYFSPDLLDIIFKELNEKK